MIRLWLIAAVCFSLAPGTVPAPGRSLVAPAERSAPASLDPADPVHHPLGFVRATWHRTRAELRGYRAHLTKQERVRGYLYPTEELAVSVRLEPYAVRFTWLAGARDVFGAPIAGLVYQAGSNNGRATVHRPAARFLSLMDVTPTDATARSASRYAATEASLLHALERTVTVWEAAAIAGRLRVEYRGIETDPRTGSRPCHVFERFCNPPEVDAFVLTEPAPRADEYPADAVSLAKIWFDVETGLQLGTVLTRADGELIASYFFRDVEVNPVFKPNEFTRAGLSAGR